MNGAEGEKGFPSSRGALRACGTPYPLLTGDPQSGSFPGDSSLLLPLPHLQYTTVQYSTVQHSAVQCSAVEWSTVKCDEVQYSAV